MNRRDFIRTCAACALAGASLGPGRSEARELLAEKGRLGLKVSPYFEPLGQGLVRCTLCPRGCEIDPGDRGHCGVRENRQGTLYSLVYGNPCAVHVDPIEKKPFYHVLPGTGSFSVATAGCNLDCKFCQNWEISQAVPDDTYNLDMPPALVAELAVASGCASVASTYVEPTIFVEYMMDIGRALKGTGALNVMHSCGYISPKALADLCPLLDAACVDLKGFTEEYYRTMTGAELAPVLAALKQLRRAGVFIELVTLVVPGANDDPKTLRAMAEWIGAELGPDTPLHFTRFHPQYKLPSLPPTPVATLERARDTAMGAGLEFVYIGNVAGHEAENTFCPGCGALLLARTGYRTRNMGMRDGCCAACGRAIPGIWSVVSKAG